MKNISILILFITAISCNQADKPIRPTYDFQQLTDDYLKSFGSNRQDGQAGQV